MENKQALTEEQAIDLVDQANLTLQRKMHTKYVEQYILSEEVAFNGLDLDQKIGDSTADLKGGKVALKNVTWGEFLQVYNDPNFTNETEIGNHYNTSQKTISRVRDFLMNNHRGAIKQRKPPKEPQVHPGSGGGGGGSPAKKDLTPIFPGEVYSNFTKIPKRRWSILNVFQKKRSVAPPKRLGILPTVFDKVFLFGFQFENEPNLFYELWFDSFNETFTIHDRFGDEVQSGFRTMNKAIDAFIDFIGSFGDNRQPDKQAERSFERTAEKSARSNVRSAREEAKDSMDFPSEQFISDEDVETLVEQFAETRGMLANIVNTELVEEYNVSRMNRRLAKKFWQVWGKDVTFPNKFLNRGVRDRLRIFGNKAEGVFVIGLTFADRMDVEVWYIKPERGTASFYVFNITAGQLVAENIKRRRDAARIAAEVIAARTGE